MAPTTQTIMEPRISTITLGVTDLGRAVGFYSDGLGFPTGYKEGEGIAFFKTGGVRLALYPRKALAEDIGPAVDPGKPGFGSVTLAHNVRTKAEVAQILALAAKAGAGCFLGRAQRLFPRSRRPPLGDREGADVHL